MWPLCTFQCSFTIMEAIFTLAYLSNIILYLLHTHIYFQDERHYFQTMRCFLRLLFEPGINSVVTEDINVRKEEVTRLLELRSTSGPHGHATAMVGLWSELLLRDLSHPINGGRVFSFRINF